MNTLVALLRAINVGGTGKISMAELRSIAEAAGFSDVRTYIQSGNLVFSSAREPSVVQSELERRLTEYAKKPVAVFVRTIPEMQGILKSNPFPHAEARKIGVLFLDRPPLPNTIRTARGLANEELVLGEREVFLHFPSGMGPSKLHLAAMTKGTMRNLNTVSNVVKMATEA